LGVHFRSKPGSEARSKGFHVTTLLGVYSQGDVVRGKKGEAGKEKEPILVWDIKRAITKCITLT
jgi:hypothetical protein